MAYPKASHYCKTSDQYELHDEEPEMEILWEYISIWNKEEGRKKKGSEDQDGIRFCKEIKGKW